MTTRQKLGIWIAAALLSAPAWPAAAAPEARTELGVARISLTNGEVTLRRADSGDWVEARVNTPLVEGDAVATARSARTEVQLDSRNFARLSGDSEVNLTELGNRRFRLQINRGTVTYNELKDGEADVDIETPYVAIRPLERGMYRIEVGFDSRTVITVRRGKAEIASKVGTQQLRQGKTMVVRADSEGNPEFHVVDAASKDDWDRWNERREKQLRKSKSRRYVSQDIYGVEDLDDHGNWQYVSGYGYSWFPSVSLGWSPYRHGRWTWLDYYGWSWVGYEPWGWAPYHYGRWYHHHHHGWGWYPGHHYGRHYWRPALVAFFGYGGHGGFRAGLGFGFGNIGWVPLAPHEPYYAWYGGRRGHGGRHGGRNTTIFVDNNVNIYNNYRNARARNGVTMVDAQDFARGRVRNPRSPRQAELRQARLMRGQVPVVPERESRGRTVRAANDRGGAAQSRNFFSRQPPRSRAPRTSFEQQRQEMSRSVQAFSASRPVNRRAPATARARSGAGGTRVAAARSAGGAQPSPGAVSSNGVVTAGTTARPGGGRSRTGAAAPNRGTLAEADRRNNAWRNFGSVRNGDPSATPGRAAVSGSRSTPAVGRNSPTPSSNARSRTPRTATTTAGTPVGPRAGTQAGAQGAFGSRSRSRGSSGRANRAPQGASSANWRRFERGARAGSTASSSRASQPSVSRGGNSASRFDRNPAPRTNQTRARGTASGRAAPTTTAGSRGFAPRGRSRVGSSGATGQGASSRGFNLPQPVTGNRANRSSGTNAAGGGSSRTFRQATPIEGSRGNRRSTFQPRGRSRVSPSIAPAGNTAGGRRSASGSRGAFTPRTSSRTPTVRQSSGSASRGSRRSAPRVSRPTSGARGFGRSSGTGRAPSFGGSRPTVGGSRSGGSVRRAPAPRSRGGFGGSARRSPAPRSGGSFGGSSRRGSFGGGRSMSRGGSMSRGSSAGGRSGGSRFGSAARSTSGSRGGGRSRRR